MTLFNTTTTGTIGIGNNQTNAILSIGTLSTRSGAINIGVSTCPVNITGVGTIKANAFDVATNSISGTLFATATTGAITIGGAQTSGSINIGTLASRTGAIGIGNTGCQVNITGTGTIKANTFDVIGTGTNVTLFNTTTTGAINIGAVQTGGSCEIASSASRTGALYINSTTGATNQIYIGAAGTTMTLDSATLSVGSTSTTTLNLGTTATTTLAIRGAAQLTSPLRLPITNTTPTTTQLGYYANNTNSTPITVTNVVSTPASSSITNLPVGIYIFNYYAISYSPSIGATQVMTYSVTTSGGATSNIPNYVFNGVATTFQDTQNLNGVVKCSTATNTISFNLIITSGGGTITVSQFGYNYIKIG